MARIKAIPTRYAGRYFRSRLEARWAVFFDACGIEWMYEPEGFRLSDGTCYLPDFYLPKFSGGIFAEVKAINGDFSKTQKFALEINKSVLFLDGEPGCRNFWMTYPQCSEEKYDDVISEEECCFYDKYLNERLFYGPGGDECHPIYNPLVYCAVQKALSARF